ncbi:MAG: alkyl/aryl-sulfatase [Coprobacillus sp.]
MLAEKKLKDFTEKSYQKAITKVNNRIYHFLGYGHSNAIAIIGDHSVILVDTLDSDQRALRLKEEIKKITDKPVKTIIFTHGHPDHQGGSGAFEETVEEIIAFKPAKTVLKHYNRLNDVLNQRGSYQHGYGLSDEEAICQGIGSREGKEVNDGKYHFLQPTTLYNESVVERVIDGVKLKLVRAIGETDDQLFVWLEDDKVICTGDNYYGCWPATYAIRGTQYRDIAAWIDTLDLILEYPSDALLPGHTKPLIGLEEVKTVITTFRNAIESILFQTLDCMNKGYTMSQTVESVKLPDEYAQCGYLGEYYGTVEWTVKGIYTGYVGWFDGDASHLLPLSDKEYNLVLLELIGNNHKVKETITDALSKEEYQKALQLISLLETNDNSNELKELKKKALIQRAKQMTSANARHYYIAASKEI